MAARRPKGEQQREKCALAARPVQPWPPIFIRGCNIWLRLLETRAATFVPTCSARMGAHERTQQRLGAAYTSLSLFFSLFLLLPPPSPVLPLSLYLSFCLPFFPPPPFSPFSPNLSPSPCRPHLPQPRRTRVFLSFHLSPFPSSLGPSFSPFSEFSLPFALSLRSFFCFITMSDRVCVPVSLGSSCRCRRGWFLALCRVFISSE